jgi:hypothetical protein
VWLDARDLQPGGDWDTQIKDALQACGGVLFVMTADSVQDYSATKYYSCRFTVSARPYVFRDGHAAACGYVSGCWGWRLD